MNGPTTALRTFLLDHEKLIIVLLLAVTCWFVTGKVENIVAKHDDKALAAITLKANTDLAAANTAAQTAATAAAAAQQEEAQYKALAAKAQAQDALYAQQLITLTQTLAAQQKKDDTLAAPALAQRWETLIGDQGVTAAASGGLYVTDDASHKTVDVLEQVPVLKSEITVTNGQLQDADALLAASNGQVSTLNTEVGALNTEASKLRSTITDDTQKCTEELKVQHDHDRKIARREIVAAYVAGFLTKLFVVFK